MYIYIYNIYIILLSMFTQPYIQSISKSDTERFHINTGCILKYGWLETVVVLIAMRHHCNFALPVRL